MVEVGEGDQVRGETVERLRSSPRMPYSRRTQACHLDGLSAQAREVVEPNAPLLDQSLREGSLVDHILVPVKSGRPVVWQKDSLQNPIYPDGEDLDPFVLDKPLNLTVDGIW